MKGINAVVRYITEHRNALETTLRCILRFIFSIYKCTKSTYGPIAHIAWRHKTYTSTSGCICTLANDKMARTCMRMFRTCYMYVTQCKSQMFPSTRLLQLQTKATNAIVETEWSVIEEIISEEFHRYSDD